MGNATRFVSVARLPVIEGLEGRMLLSSAWVGTWDVQLTELELQNSAIVQKPPITNVATITQLGDGSFRLTAADGFSIDLTGDETSLAANFKGQSDGSGGVYDQYFRLQKFDNAYASVFSGRIDYDSSMKTQITSADLSAGLASPQGTPLNIVSFPWPGSFTFHGLSAEATFNHSPNASSFVSTDTQAGAITFTGGQTYQIGPVGKTPDIFTLSGNQLIRSYRGLQDNGQTRVRSLARLMQGPGDRMFNVGVWAGFDPVTGRIGYVSLDSGYTDPFKAAPVLKPSAVMNIPTISEDDRANSGTSIATLIASSGINSITDLNKGAKEGIALTDVNAACGRWQYSLNGGTTWANVGAISDTSSLLLGSDAQNRLRLLPARNYSGTIADAITFRAWDQTAKSNGARVDVSNNGGTRAYSSASAVASIRVKPVNDAPVLSRPVTIVLAGAALNRNFNISFNTLATAIQALTSYRDVENTHDSLALRITALNGSLKVGGVSAGSDPVLLRTGEAITWRPATNAKGKITALQVQIWDGKLASAGFVTVIIRVV